MKTHRFTGATSREVLNKVKLMLGEDAMILSNRSVDGGIEIVAIADAEMIDEPVRAPRRAPAGPAPRRAAFEEDLDDDGYVDGLSRVEPRASRAAPSRPAAVEQ